MNKHTFLVSDETKNSHGFKVITAGIDIEQFARNPIMLYMHNRKSNVIGKWENIRKEGDKMYADAIFDTQDPQAKLISNKVENGFIKSASLGIEVLEQKGDTVTKCKLFEISIVDIGSNQNALKLYNKTEIKQLFFNLNIDKMDLLQSLIALLGLEPGATEEAVLKKVEELLAIEKEQEKGQTEVKQETLKRSLQAGKITAEMLPQFSKMLDLDHEGTLQLLSKMPDKITLSTAIVKPGSSGGEGSTTEKPKSKWNLEDYRQFAPEDLEKDPALYQRLLDSTFNN